MVTRSVVRKVGRLLAAAVATTAILVVAPATVGAGTAQAAPAYPPVAFHAAGGDLWSLNNGNGRNYGIQVRSGTSPAICRVFRGDDFQIAYQNTAGNLQLAGFETNTGTGLAMANGTSPDITELPPPSTAEGSTFGSRYVVAFQNRAGNLQTTGYLKSRDWGLGMAPGTNPAITATELNKDGIPQYTMAIQANTGNLITLTDSLYVQDWGVRLAPGTSPSITTTPFTGYSVAFQGSNGNLMTLTNGSFRDWGVGMAPGTSPSITRISSSGLLQIAFQANTGTLWTVGNAGDRDWRLGMQPGTSPSIGRVGDGSFEVAFHSAGGDLWTVGGAGDTNWQLRLGPGTSPSIATVL